MRRASYVFAFGLGALVAPVVETLTRLALGRRFDERFGK